MTTKKNIVGSETVFMPAAGWKNTADTHSEFKTRKGNRFMHAVNHRTLVSTLIICLTIIFPIMGVDRSAGWAATDPEWDDALHLSQFQFNYLNEEILPKIGGNTGSAVQSLPISVPPGRAGLQPQLALTYNSSSRNGWVGVGWNLDVGSIQRATRNGLHYNGFRFLADGAELVAVEDEGVGKYYRAKIEDAFKRYYYISVTDGWRVTSRDGTTFYYGTSPDSRQEDAPGVFKWCLDRVVDTNGNEMTYTYVRDQGAIYLDRIDYAGGLNYVVFIRDTDRNDVTTMYNTHFAVTTRQRLVEIKTYGNGELAHTYTLTYEQGDISGRSRLERFHNNNLPPVDILYQEGGMAVKDVVHTDGSEMPYEESTKYFADINGDNRQDLIKYNSYGDFTIHFANSDGSFGPAIELDTSGLSYDTHRYHFPDVNGDGKADLVKHNEYERYHVFLSQGDGTFSGPVETVAEQLFQEWHVRHFADVNGDGLADLVKESFGIVQAYLSNGDGTFGGPKEDGTYGTPISSDSPTMSAEQGDKYLADVNGDGLADFIKHNLYGLYHVQLSTGDGHFGTAIPTQLVMSTSDWPEVYPVDLNGDGLSDLVRWDIHSRLKAHLSLGDGTFSPEIVSETEDMGSESRFIHFADMNGDGLADFVKQNLVTEQYGIYFSKGDGTFDYNGRYISTEIMNYGEGIGHVVDVTGDGVSDIIKHTAYGDYDVYAIANMDADLMRGVGVAVDNSGADIFVSVTEIEYRPSSEYENLVLPFVMPTVASVSRRVMTNTENADGFIESVNQYDYTGGYYDAEMREFRGFETVVNTRPDGAKVTTHYHQDLYFKNKANRISLAEPDGTVLQETTSTWAKNPTDDDWAFVYLESTHTDYHFNPTVFSQTDYTYSTTHGGVLTQISSGTGAESITTSYVHVNKGAWVWRTASESVTGSTSGQLRETFYEYQTDTGNLLAQEMWLFDGTNPRVTMTYDAYGNLHTRTNARGFTTTTDYDTVMHAFPVKITSPRTGSVDHVVEYRNYDYRWGKPQQSVDENWNVIDYSYDGLGRLLQADLPDGGQMRRVFVDDAFPRSVTTYVREKEDDGTSPESTVDVFDWFDGYGRKMTTFTYGDPDQDNDYTLQLVRTDSYFDEMGRNYYNVGPYFDGSGEDKPSARTFFDYLNRPTRIEKPDAEHGTITTTFTYSGFDNTVTDPDGASKTEIKDYLGRITRVIEHADAGDQYTDYDYNAVGELEKITDHLYHETTIVYDTLGRKTAMNDPDMGAWSYAYDDNGNLKTQTDNKSQTVTFEYDELDRMVSKVYDTGDDPVIYTYDHIEPLGNYNGIGRLHEIAKGDVRTVMVGYDAMGRSLGETRYIPGMAPATTEFDYDLSGKLETVTYPNGIPVNTAYIIKTGLIGTISIPGAATPLIVASFYDYRPSGKINIIKRGHADGGGYLLTDTYTYAPLSDRLERITTQAAGESEWLQYKEYDYTPAGDIEQIRDSANSRTYTYTYDKLHRLTSETAVGMFAYRPDSEFVYGYDEAIQPHAVQSIAVNGTPAAGFYYDGNGNLTDGPDLTDPDGNMVRNLAWDADNMPISVAHSQHGTTTFLYDGNGRRVKKTSPAGSSYYINQYYEVINGSWVMYIWAGNQRIAQWKEGQGLHYFHKDHLGSSSFVTNEDGVKIESTEYLPFGGEREHNGIVASNYKFTDQEHDTSTGFYNYDARLYDPVIGRFVSPDPHFSTNQISHGYYTRLLKKQNMEITLSWLYVGNDIAGYFGNPQNIDRYAYVTNNPLRFTDPVGLGKIDMAPGERKLREMEARDRQRVERWKTWPKGNKEATERFLEMTEESYEPGEPLFIEYQSIKEREKRKKIEEEKAKKMQEQNTVDYSNKEHKEGEVTGNRGTQIAGDESTNAGEGTGRGGSAENSRGNQDEENQ